MVKQRKREQLIRFPWITRIAHIAEGIVIAILSGCALYVAYLWAVYFWGK